MLFDRLMTSFLYLYHMAEYKQPENTNSLVAEPEQLLYGRTFYPVGNQIMYHSNGKLVITQITEEASYTVNDYLKLPEGAPYQLIHGKLIYMASAKRNHQRIQMRLSAFIFNYVDSAKLGEILTAPMDVHFDEDNVFQPDILFVSIKRKAIIKDWIMGAPDFVVEILSKSTEQIDRVKKMQTYGEYEVVEYWIVNLNDQNIEVYHNQDMQMFLAQTAGKADTIESKAIEGFTLEVKRIFE